MNELAELVQSVQTFSIITSVCDIFSLSHKETHLHIFPSLMFIHFVTDIIASCYIQFNEETSDIDITSFMDFIIFVILLYFGFNTTRQRDSCPRLRLKLKAVALMPRSLAA